MQLHKRLTTEQIQLVLDWYNQDLMTRDKALLKLGVKRRRFYVLQSAHRAGTLTTIAPLKRRNTHRRINPDIEVATDHQQSRKTHPKKQLSWFRTIW